MADEPTTQLHTLFSPHTPLPSDVLHELSSLTSLLSLTPEELFYKWESYAIKMGTETTQMSFKTVKDFKKDLQDALGLHIRRRSEDEDGAVDRDGRGIRKEKSRGHRDQAAEFINERHDRLIETTVARELRCTLSNEETTTREEQMLLYLPSSGVHRLSGPVHARRIRRN
nr:hypothetical protein B0A51_05039 [Rachicladosporium sp. CCFEE 5018]